MYQSIIIAPIAGTLLIHMIFLALSPLLGKTWTWEDNSPKKINRADKMRTSLNLYSPQTIGIITIICTLYIINLN